MKTEIVGTKGKPVISRQLQRWAAITEVGERIAAIANPSKKYFNNIRQYMSYKITLRWCRLEYEID